MDMCQYTNYLGNKAYCKNAINNKHHSVYCTSVGTRVFTSLCLFVALLQNENVD